MKTKASKLFLIAVFACFILLLAFLIPVNAEEANEPTLIGDVYKDGKINSKDAIYLLQYLAYMVEIDEDYKFIANLYVEDNNADGTPKLNAKDALILLQYLAQMDVKLGEGEWSIVTAPTRDKVGQAKRNTASGFDTFTIPMVSENDYAVTVTKQPLCYEEGEKSLVYTSEEKGLQYTVKEKIPKVAHNEVVDKAVAPTCKDTGLTQGSHCSMCNATIKKQETVPVTNDHNVVQDAYKAPECEKTGLTAGSHCKDCGKVLVKQTTIPSLGHTEVTDKAVEATCSSEGKTEGSHCSACNKVIKAQQTVEKAPHEFSNFKCTACNASEFKPYASYVEYHSLCNVSDNGSNVILTYNSPENVELLIDSFNLGSSQYVFKFGPNSGKVKITSSGRTYTNVKIQVEARVGAFDLVLDHISFSKANTIISSSASLNLGFYGASCSVSTTNAGNGANGGRGENGLNSNLNGYPSTYGKPGGNGGSANIPITCNGTLVITCASQVTIKGGNGGNGGNGGESGDSAGAKGGDGGNGGNGAHALSASVINVYFANGSTRSNISISGGTGGSGSGTGSGTGGTGTGSSVLKLNTKSRSSLLAPGVSCCLSPMHDTMHSGCIG